MSKHKIAIIEDNEDVRENLVELLELTGYEVEAAPDGRKGIEMIRQFLPNLVLCDVMMPELDGYGVLHVLSKDEKTAGIPFIFLTAKADKIDFRKGMSLGADDYITKPYDDTDLLGAIETRLKKTQALKAENETATKELPVSLADILENAPLMKLKARDILYHEGDLPRAIYYLKKGKIKLFKTDTYGKELIVDVLEKESIIGYLSLLDGNKQTETAVAIDETEVQLIPGDTFLSLLEKNVEESMQLLKRMAKNLAQHEERLLSMAYASLRERVADHLLVLSQNENEISLSRNDIAAGVGTASESLIRVLSEFKEDGCIELRPKSILVKDKSKLKSLSSKL